MTWLKVEDRMSFHPKMLAAGNAAVGAWVRICAWCAMQLTDGLIPEPIAKMIGTDEELRSLVSVGLLETEPGSYRVHDYLHYNPTREEALAYRAELSEKRREAGKRGALSRWQNGKPHGNTMANTKWQTDGPSRPVPLREKRERERSDQDRNEPGSGTVPVAPIHTPVHALISDSKHRARAEKDVERLTEWSKAEARKVGER